MNTTIHRVIQGDRSHVLSGLSVVKSTSHNRSNRPQPPLTTQTTSLHTVGSHKTWLVPPFWLTHATQYNRLSQISSSITHPAMYIPRAHVFSYILHQSLLRRRGLLWHCILESVLHYIYPCYTLYTLIHKKVLIYLTSAHLTTTEKDVRTNL